jgi:surface protein
MGSMFADAILFNQPLSGWNVSNVTDMNSMFANVTSFNQNIGSWDVSNVAVMKGMLDNTSLSQSNYDALLIGWDGLPSLQYDVLIGVQGLLYTSGGAADTARSNIISNYNWVFDGDAPV